MAKRSLVEELDEAVEGMIRNPEAPLPEADPRIAPLIHLAADLRDLPGREFQTHLKNELLPSGPDTGQTVAARSVAPACGVAEPLKTADQISRQLGDLAAGTELAPKDLRAAVEGLPEMSMRFLASLDQCAVGVSRFSDQRPNWERHLDGEELLHVLEGELDVTTLTDAGPVHTSVPAGSIFVCPRGLWHWPRPRPTASLLFVKPEKGTENSRAIVPRQDAGRRVRTGGIRKTVGGIRKSAGARRKPGAESRAAGPGIMARDVRAALTGIPVLAISDRTTGEEAGAAFPQLGSLNECGLYAGRFSGLSPWERHTSADELLHVIEGEIEITTLTDAGPVRNTLRAGTIFVCPRGLWHRQYSAGGALEFSATPQPTEVSFADDPRV